MSTVPAPTLYPSDFVQVQLSAAGQKLAGEHPMHVAGARRSFIFSGDATQKVERSFEWRMILSRMHTPAGEAIFELVPDPTAAAIAASGKAPAPVTAPVYPNSAAAGAATAATAEAHTTADPEEHA